MTDETPHLARQRVRAHAHERVMGEPSNIIFWLVLAVGWTLVFVAKLVSTDANFLPAWFTGTAYNFPLHLVTTTVAELFIGFLVAAAAKRAHRVFTAIIDGIRTVLDQVERRAILLARNHQPR